MTATATQPLSASELAELDALLLEDEFQREILPKVRNGDGIRPGALYWLQECTATRDEKWQEHGFKTPNQPFPRLPYLPWLFNLLLTEKRLMISKSRELLLSWSVVGFGVWLCQVRPSTRVVIQTQKLDKGIELVKGSGVPGYARSLWENQSARLKLEFSLTKPMEDQPSDSISWANQSVLQCVPVGPDQIRSLHPTLVIFDEGAYLEAFADSWQASESVAERMVALGSVQPSTFWDVVRVANG